MKVDKNIINSLANMYPFELKAVLPKKGNWTKKRKLSIT
jgi:hypothetical protein